MGGVRTGRLAVAASLLVVLASGCTSPPDPKPSPTSVVSTPVVSTPVENAQEREQRLAYEAAEKSYREFRAEYQEQSNAGGATTPTPRMKKTAGGPYLKQFAEALRALKELHNHTAGSERIVYVRRHGYSPNSLSLQVCEDSRGVKYLNSRGKQIAKGELRTATLEIRRTDHTWKLWSGTGQKVNSCE